MDRRRAGRARRPSESGDAGALFDTLHRLTDGLPGDTVLLPGHDYNGRTESTLAKERADNPWLALSDRAAFVASLTANPPPRPANMDDLLRLNRAGVDIPAAVSAAEAARLVAAGGAVSVIDVRTSAEYAAEHIPGSRLIPVDEVEKRVDEVRAVPAPRLLLCRSGNRAKMAQAALAKHHVAGLCVVEGGVGAFSAAGGVTAKGRAVLPLERQVRIAAGLLVLAGVLAGAFAHPGFLFLAGFVGAGLIFAGATDWCGMSMLLAKMPWNRVAVTDGAAAGGTCSASAPGACAASVPSACSAGKPPSNG
jgi:rhodanese-related sulfurtransferase